MCKLQGVANQWRTVGQDSNRLCYCHGSDNQGSSCATYGKNQGHLTWSYNTCPNNG